MVSHADSYPALYEYIMEMVHCAAPPYMRMSHLTSELRAIVQAPHACIYDGLLGVPIDVYEFCERIASCRVGAPRPPHHAQLFVPLRLEHWMVRHLVTIHLFSGGGGTSHEGVSHVAYYDPHGASYEDESRVIVGLNEADNKPITPRRLVEILMRSLPGWTCHSVGRKQQGVFSPFSCGLFNLQYISECVSGVTAPIDTHHELGV